MEERLHNALNALCLRAADKELDALKPETISADDAAKLLFDLAQSLPPRPKSVATNRPMGVENIIISWAETGSLGLLSAGALCELHDTVRAAITGTLLEEANPDARFISVPLLDPKERSLAQLLLVTIGNSDLRELRGRLAKI